jgi:5-methylcytosine-specific restriction enzyme subunit McrC
MSIFDLHSNVVQDYRHYVQSFLSISDDRLREFVEKQLVDEAIFWPDALVQLNPAYKLADDVAAVASTGLLTKVATQPSRVSCTFDEMSVDVLTNQILKASLGQVLETEGLDRDIRAEVRQARRLFDQVSDIELTPRVFYQVRVHQNNRLYAFLVNVCRFLFDSLQALDHAGGYKFQDVLREPERLRRIYEKFVRNFYRRCQSAYGVKRDRMEWVGGPLDGADFGLVPQMETDVTLRSSARTIVVECKYTESIYQQNYFKGKFRSEHLYQLGAYLQNLEPSSEGILLYPTAGVAVDQSYMLHGHRVRVTTLDLYRPWPQIASSLLTLLEDPAT